MLGLPIIKNTMAAAATKTIVKTVRPHIPLIKFPSRGSTVKNPVDAVSTSAGKVESKASGTKKTTTVTRQTIDSSQLPLKYHRKPLTNEEIEIIEKGGRL